jgi:hypothetical protein
MRRRRRKEAILKVSIVLPQYYHRIDLENLYQILLPQKAGTLRI